MNTPLEPRFQAHEFAKLTGVTVRTLHHYDRLGLLRPAKRTRAGYRLYNGRDITRLQQIMTLKFLGFPLNDIKDLLERNLSDLSKALRLQRELLAEKRRLLDLAVRAVEHAERILASGQEPPREAFVKIMEAIHMQNNKEWMKSHYTEEQLKDLASRYSPEIGATAQRDWAALIRDVEASLGEDPASEKAQALAARWEALIEAFTGGDPGIRENLAKLYADRSNWPDTFQKPYSDEVGAFIGRAAALRKQ